MSMKEPKYKIGDVFFSTYGIPDDGKDGHSKFMFVPAVGVITKITIDKKDIVYVLTEYLKTNKDMRKRDNTRTEKQLEEHSRTLEEVKSRLIEDYDEYFADLRRKVNKEKLTDVLNGN